ncbi:MAG: hypothetical protein QOI58_1413 [Thermoanaerobaculia bacterium]|jgi:hypothetical protein|nr:hypothetical protein [Thermoanaerobaculia bacterium]
MLVLTVGSGRSSEPVIAQGLLGDAGRVQVDAPASVSFVDLVSVQGTVPNGEVSYLRRVSRQEFAHPAQMPAGTCVALGYGETGELLGVTNLVAVAKNAVAAAKLRPLSSRDVLAKFEAKVQGDLLEGFRATIEAPSPRSADAMFRIVDGMAALWYHVDEPRVTLSAASEHGWTRPEAQSVRRTGPTSLTTSFRRLPSLTVSLVAEPPIENASTFKLSLRKEGSVAAIRDVEMRIGQVLALSDLPATNIELTLSAPAAWFSQRVDLSSGDDSNARFTVSPVILRGDVKYGSDSARAKITFLGRVKTEVLTNELGEYRVTLWHPGRYPLKVTLIDHEDIPEFDDNIRIDESRSYDIRVPRNRISVAVSDVDARPLPGAEVHVTSASKSTENGDQRFLVNVPSGADGVAILPPIRPGQLEIRATKGGYRVSEPITLPVTPDMSEQSVRVVLHKDEDPDIEIVLPNGEPASGAEITIASKSTCQLLGRSSTDEQGHAAVPFYGDEMVIVRHSAAAVDIVFAADLRRSGRLQLSPAGMRLQVTVVDRSRAAVSGAAIVLFWRNFTLFGPALASVAQFTPSTALGGEWMFVRPPAEALAILAMRAVPPAPALMKSLAAELAYPWPTQRIVQAVE